VASGENISAALAAANNNHEKAIMKNGSNEMASQSSIIVA